VPQEVPFTSVTIRVSGYTGEHSTIRLGFSEGSCLVVVERRGNWGTGASLKNDKL